ncbi:MAG: transglutaminase domain-containing protein [Clostridia bacterium]|nr:transglutaminase domain-containing protein [Clostridia bacterium]
MNRDKVFNALGGLIIAMLFTHSAVMMFLSVRLEETVDVNMTRYLWTGLAVSALCLMALSVSPRVTWFVLIAALAVGVQFVVFFGWRPVTALVGLVRGIVGRDPDYPVEREILCYAILVMIYAYTCCGEPFGIKVLLVMTGTFAVVWWFRGEELNVKYSFGLLLAVSAMYAVNGRLHQTSLKALLSASLIAALVAVSAVPEQGVTVPAMRQAGLKVMRFLTDTFNLDRNDTEQRRPFNIGSYGWRTSSDSFGGPVYPQSGVDVLRVEADETLYLRGAIRYTYNLRAWVDESNDEKAGKIKRYMLGGIEGLLYRSEFELAQDLTKERLLRADFALKTARVEVLDEHPYWSVYSPGRTRSVKAVSDFRVLYNNIGEVFSSRRLKAGDVYELEYYSFAGSDEDMRNAVISAANSDDDAYAAALLLNRDIPKSVDSRLFRLVYEITDGITEPYDAACAIRDYLRSAGTYTLTPPYPPLDMDFVSYFVLENPRGYCVYFASAMTLMARIAGLPARYVEGYLAEPGPDGTCVVTGANAHAWSEVYFPGFGWVTFEATASNDDGNENGNDGGNGGNAPDTTPSPTPTPTPAPTPTPEPTPAETPTPSPDDTQTPDESGDAAEPEQTPGPDLGGESTPEPTLPPQTDDGSNWEDDASDKRGNGTGIWLVLLTLLLLLALAALIARRLHLSRPDIAEKRFSDRTDKLMLWYRACLLALECAFLRYGEGYTPSSYAEKAAQMGLADENFRVFSDLVSRQSYSGRELKTPWRELAEKSYRGIVGRMSLHTKLMWLAKRVKNQLGSVEQVP